MSWEKRKSLMENDARSREILIFLLASFLLLGGFFALYGSGVSLDYLIDMNADLPGKMAVPAESFSLPGFVIANFSPVIMAVAGLLSMCLALSILSVTKIGNYRYFLIIPIFLSGILFNYSILFLFFGSGLFVACLYVIPLGETYFLELKRWKFFRVGSNAVGKGLLVLFLFVLVGSYVALSTDKQYGERFYESLSESISNMALREVENAQAQQEYPADSGELFVKESMNQMRIDYPNLTEAQYLQMESQLTEEINAAGQASAASKEDVEGLVGASLKNSPLLNGLLLWFPLFFSFTIWATLEALRMLIFSPISGVFTYILFCIPFFGDGRINADSRESVPAIEYKAEVEKKTVDGYLKV